MKKTLLRILCLSLVTTLALGGCTSPYASEPTVAGYPTAEPLPSATSLSPTDEAQEPSAEVTPTAVETEAQDAQPTTEPLPTAEPSPTPEPSAWRSLSNLDDVQDLYEASNGRIWAATSGGVVIWDLEAVTHTVLRVEDGLPSNDARAIAETDDGAIWIGTSAGLARIENDQVVGTVGADVLGGGSVEALLADSQGRLWVGTQGAGAVRYDGTSWQPLHFSDNAQGNNVYSLFEDAEGRIWFGGMGLAYLDGEEWQTLDDDNVSGQGILAIMEDTEGTLWLGTPFALVRYADGAFESLSFPRMALYTVNDIWQDSKGQVWLGTEKGGLWTVDGSTWTQVSEDSGLPATSVRKMLVTNDGSLLLATDEGLYQQVGEAWRPYLVGDAPAGNDIRALLVDDDGILWVGSRGRVLSAFNGNAWHDIGEGNLQPTNIIALGQTPDGYIWAADPGHGVWRIQGVEAELVTADDGLASNQVTGLAVDAAGVVWVSTMEGVSAWDGSGWATYTISQGLLADQTVGVAAGGEAAGDAAVWVAAVTDGVARYQADTWTSFGADAGLPTPRANCLAADGAGVWLGYASSQLGAQRQLMHYDGSAWSSVAAAEGLPAADPQALLADGDALWLGTDGLGLARYAGDAWEVWTSRDGLASDDVTALAAGDAGVLWIGTDAGLTRLDTTMLD